MQKKLDCMKIACNIIVVQTRNIEGERRYVAEKHISPRDGKRQLAILLAWPYPASGGRKAAMSHHYFIFRATYYLFSLPAA